MNLNSKAFISYWTIHLVSLHFFKEEGVKNWSNLPTECKYVVHNCWLGWGSKSGAKFTNVLKKFGFGSSVKL